MRAIAWCIGTYALLRDRMDSYGRDERGLSQSTENAILLAGAVTVAGVIITVITAYVKTHLPD
ncbi:MAG: hypothetical protein FWD80_04990 [Propionibacteriaceae bacterium]|nr:hypothetical protein [Propionibacteriaceae bacterium]